jgi:hypothetical protein
LKSVFIIAIVAVAMIGVMVPSVFASIDNYKNIKVVISDVKIIEKDYKDFISYTVTMRDSTLKVYEDYSIYPSVIRTYIDYGDDGAVSYGMSSGTIKDRIEGCEHLDLYHYLDGEDGGIYSFKMCNYVEKGYDEFLVVMDWDVLPGVYDKEGATFEEKNRVLERIPKNNVASNAGGGCLIATATYGSELATEVQQLRELRDNQLLQTESGTAFMATFNDIYYSFSPTIADYERENPLFKEAVKIAITPMISSLSLMENAETESEVLSIGISLIALNLGMYLGVPAIVVIGIRKKF